MSELPNPAFIVVNVSDISSLDAVVKELSKFAPEEDGNPLTPLGSHRYVMSRTVSKRIRASKDEPLQFLEGLKGVDLARFMRGDQITACYGALDPADRARSHGRASGSAPAEPAAVPWHHCEIRVPEARELLRKQGLLERLGRRRVAVIDTGYTRHSCFGEWDANQANQNACVLVAAGENYVESGPPIDPFEQQYPGHPGHGTRVASVIAATEKVAGVASGAKLVPYRVTRKVVTDDTTPLHKALNDAMSEGCEIANISLGCPCNPGRENGRAVDKAYHEGMIVVAAAGNVTSEVTYPGRHARTITAGGVTMNGKAWKPWCGGSRGPRVDFCAPADRITRADWVAKGDGTWSDEFEEEEGDGTSYAAALISGIACLWVARWGSELARYQGWQMVEAFRKVLGDTCQAHQGWDHKRFGRGVVNAEAALKAGLPDPGDLVRAEDKAENDVF